MMAADLTHQERIRQELMQAGLTKLAQFRPSSRYVPKIIHENEHIIAVASGRYDGGTGILIATDLRIIFLDHKPGFTICDEISFDVVTGIKSSHIGPFSSITLHSRIGDYELRHINNWSAKKFVRYIEDRRVEGVMPQRIPEAKLFQVAMAMSPEAEDYLASHDTAVISTEDRQGTLHGAAVHYLAGKNGKIYILTRSETTKAHDILMNDKVALTIYEPDPASTLQVQGTAKIETDQNLKNEIFSKLTQPRLYKSGVASPPVTSLTKGSFEIIGITPTSASFRPFHQQVSDHI